MSYIELCHFATLYPQRVLKLVFLDAAYDNSSPEYKPIQEKNPLRNIIPAWPDDDPNTIEDYIVTLKRFSPALAVIWGEVMDEQTRHTVRITPEGKVVDKMSDAIYKAINDTFTSYVPEYSNIQAPVLSIYAIRDGSDFLSADYMTDEQKTKVMDYFRTVLTPFQKRTIRQFQRNLPQAKIMEIPKGHHYCFIKQEELVFGEMRKFLLEA